jgi:hypothetical protein
MAARITMPKPGRCVSTAATPAGSDALNPDSDQTAAYVVLEPEERG